MFFEKSTNIKEIMTTHTTYILHSDLQIGRPCLYSMQKGRNMARLRAKLPVRKCLNATRGVRGGSMTREDSLSPRRWHFCKGADCINSWVGGAFVLRGRTRNEEMATENDVKANSCLPFARLLESLHCCTSTVEYGYLYHFGPGKFDAKIRLMQIHSISRIFVV